LTELLRLSMANDHNERHQCHNEPHQRYLINISAFTKGRRPGLPHVHVVSLKLKLLAWPSAFRHFGLSLRTMARNSSALHGILAL
jgi:hypothetical protein